jgi:hypothetical protein
VPVCEVERDRGVKAGFGDAEANADCEESGARGNERHGAGGSAPRGEHDGQALARADTTCQDGSGDVEEEVGEEEEGGAGGVVKGGEGELFVHGQRGEGQV